MWSELGSVAPLELPDLDLAFALGAPTVKPAAKVKEGLQRKKGLTVLSQTRSQNVGIMLARFRMPHAAIRDAVLHVDDGKLSIDNLKAIKHHVPTTDEVCAEAETAGRRAN